MPLDATTPGRPPQKGSRRILQTVPRFESMRRPRTSRKTVLTYERSLWDNLRHDSIPLEQLRERRRVGIDDLLVLRRHRR